MAAAFFNVLADPTVAHALSAGTEPAASVHPEVVEAMREVGIDLSAAQPRRLTAAVVAQATLMVTMGCGEACPVRPDLQRKDWNVADPKDQPPERVRAIRDELRERVERLVAAEGWQIAPERGRRGVSD
jgi:arsenate reductase